MPPQSFTLATSDDDANAPVARKKQRSSFPPNYIHSLDGAHMMMTAMACREEGMSFAGVHDSYWTHACDVDRMNVLIRCVEGCKGLRTSVPLLDKRKVVCTFVGFALSVSIRAHALNILSQGESVEQA